MASNEWLHVVRLSQDDLEQGLARLREAGSQRPGSVVVAVGSHDTLGVALHHGASIAVTSDVAVPEVFRALADAMRPPPAPASARARAILTDRQLEILVRLCRSESRRSVANDLKISEKTLNNHLAAAYRRLRVQNLAQAAVRAAQLGVIDVS